MDNFDVKKLDTTVSAGAKVKETAYSLLARQQIPLKKKYRLGGTEYSKGSNNSNGRAGVARHKITNKNSGKPRQMGYFVDAATGKGVFKEIS